MTLMITLPESFKSLGTIIRTYIIISLSPAQEII